MDLNVNLLKWKFLSSAISCNKCSTLYSAHFYILPFYIPYITLFLYITLSCAFLHRSQTLIRITIPNTFEHMFTLASLSTNKQRDPNKTRTKRREGEGQDRRWVMFAKKVNDSSKENGGPSFRFPFRILLKHAPASKVEAVEIGPARRSASRIELL